MLNWDSKSIGLCVKKLQKGVFCPMCGFNHRFAGDLDSFNDIAYFFSAFLKDNLYSISLPTVPVFCNEWGRSIVCVKWIIAQDTGAAKRRDERAGHKVDQWKWRVQRPSYSRSTLCSLTWVTLFRRPSVSSENDFSLVESFFFKALTNTYFIFFQFFTEENPWNKLKRNYTSIKTPSKLGYAWQNN